MINKIQNINKDYNFTGNLKKEISEKTNSKLDSQEISDTAKIFNKIDNFLNLGKEGKFNLSDIKDMPANDKKVFLKTLSSLIKNGIIGYEELEVNGKKEKHFIVNQIGNQRLKGAKLYKDRDSF